MMMMMMRCLLALSLAVAAACMVHPAEAVECVSTPLPSSPVPPVFGLDVDGVLDSHIDVWRHPCDPASGLSFIVLLRITPTTRAFVCGDNFLLLQNGIQWKVDLSCDSCRAPFCGNIQVPATFIPVASGQSFQPDFTKAFSLVYSDIIDTWQLDVPPGAVGSSLCVPSATVLCLDDQPGDGRFEVQVTYQTSQGGGSAGNGQAIALSDLGVTHGGLMWFFEASNPELLVKVLPKCSDNAHFWVFASAGTNVGVAISITDMKTGALRVYTNPDLRAMVPVQDIAAFPCP